jgi:hypothetical protein
MVQRKEILHLASQMVGEPHCDIKPSLPEEYGGRNKRFIMLALKTRTQRFMRLPQVTIVVSGIAGLQQNHELTFTLANSG